MQGSTLKRFDLLHWILTQIFELNLVGLFRSVASRSNYESSIEILLGIGISEKEDPLALVKDRCNICVC